MNEPVSQAQPPAPVKRRSKGSRTLSRWIKRALVAFVGLLVAGLVVYGWLPKPLEVEAATVSRGPMRVTVDEDGITRVKERYVVRAPITGELARIALVAGDTVAEGGVLAKLFPSRSPLLDPRSRATAEANLAAAVAAERQSKARVEHAKAAFEFARDEVRRLEQLLEKGAAPAREMDQARFNERSAEAELRAAELGARVAVAEIAAQRAALDSGEKGDGRPVDVLAPIRGRVLRVLEQSAGFVPAGTPLVELGDVGELEVVVDVLTRDAVAIERGAEAWLERWGGDPIPAEVERVEPSGFTRLSALGVEEQRVNVILRVASPPPSLGDGFRVEVKIVVWQDASALRVPASALFRHGDGWALYEIAGGRAHKRAVTIGRRTGTEAQILEGLSEGARVVVHPSDRLADGVEVRAP
jgi:HlyD family secretion protein